MPTADTFHGAMLWAILWVTGVIPTLLLLYIPIGVSWIVGYSLYLGVRRMRQSFSASALRQGEPRD